MTDFMEFLYQHYIRPYVEAPPKDDGDAFRASLCEKKPDCRNPQGCGGGGGLRRHPRLFAGSAHRIGTSSDRSVKQRASGGPLSTGGKG